MTDKCNACSCSDWHEPRAENARADLRELLALSSELWSLEEERRCVQDHRMGLDCRDPMRAALVDRIRRFDDAIDERNDRLSVLRRQIAYRIVGQPMAGKGVLAWHAPLNIAPSRSGGDEAAHFRCELTD